MALDVEVGSFQVPTSTGVQTITLVDSGITPKVVILMSSKSTSDGAVQDQLYTAIGWATSTTSRYAVCTATEDNVGTTDCARRHSNEEVFTLIDHDGTILAEGDLDSFNAGNFKINWSTAPGTAFTVCYMVLGGTDIENASTGLIDSHNGTGNVSYTGIGFKPSAVFFLSCQNGNSQTAPPSTQISISNLSIGMMTDGNGSKSWAYVSENGVTTTNVGVKGALSELVIAYSSQAIKSGLPTTRGVALFASMDDDGFTLDWTDSAEATFDIGYLAIRGGQWQLVETAGTGLTGNQSISNFGFKPQAVMTIDVKPVALHNFALGMAADDGGAAPFPAVSIFGTDDNNVGTSDTHRYTSVADVLTNASDVGVIDAAATLDSFDASGVTLNFNNAYGGRYWTLMIGPSTGAEDAVQRRTASIGSANPFIF